MRPRTPPSPRRTASVTAALAAATVVVPPSAVPALAATPPPPSCVGGDARAFPLSTRIRGGPGSYEAGGGYGTWYIDLTNTTPRTCAGIHPVVVLVDDKRALRPDQPHLDFYDGARNRPVTFESTDEQELVGVLDGAGFGGFTVPPGRTVSVRVRLALPSDAVADQVTANAAVVQRRGEDGDWVGESNAYRFSIGEEGEGGEGEEETQEAVREDQAVQEAENAQETEGLPTTPSSSAPATDSGTADTDGTDGTGGTGTNGTDGRDDPDGSDGRYDPDDPDDPDGPYDPDDVDDQDDQDTSLTLAQGARELARTGLGGPGALAHGLLAALAALGCVGAGAYLLVRNRR
ncbi:hypothetical protein [Streptomyces cinerochromogenes]|uniref:hypothetical protein n=1 Tax=Streptomyces cinerochromogenes TaxID=66422 RepID=UPI001671203B|nr:hypothetical protein [Streptomyces cinerochromogenes]GGS47077.1 hypothetical protein GCM10010206_06060 [Streptomyces cinerochromogenes]